MKKLCIVLALLFGLCLIVLIFGSKILEQVIVAGVETKGPEVLNAPVTLEDLSLSLLGGRCEVDELVIGTPEGFSADYSARLGHLVFDLKTLSLLSDKIVINEIVIDSPEIYYEVTASGTNFSALLSQIEKSEKEEQKEEAIAEEVDGGGSQVKVEIKRLSFTNGKMVLVNKLLDGGKMELALPPIELKDIGSSEEGATLASVMKTVVGSINKEAIQTATQSGGEMGKEIMRSTETLRSNLKGLFQKEEPAN